MNFHFKFVDGPRKPWEGPAFAARIGEMLEAAHHPCFQRVNDPKQADVICLVESVEFKNWRYLDVLRKEPELQRNPNRCFTLNYDDDAVGILAGCYAGLPKNRFDDRRHRPTCYLLPPDALAESFAERRANTQRKHLLSFRGAASHPLRDGLFENEEKWKEFGPIAHIDRWFNHSDSQKADYFAEILQSEFVLCPRGISPTSHRLFEVMQLGRVPVILSDAWVPPNGPDWASCSLWIAEANLEQIPDLLMARRSEAECMGSQARSEWEAHLSPEQKLVSAARSMESILLRRPIDHDEEHELRKWRSPSRHWQMGWTFPQRLVRKLRK